MQTKNKQKIWRPRALFVTSGLFFDPTSPSVQEKFGRLSGYLDGVVLGAVYRREYCRTMIGSIETRSVLFGKWLGGYRLISRVGRLVVFSVFVLRQARRLNRSAERPFDVVISTDPFKSGTYARLIRWMTGAKCVMELNGNYAKSFLIGDNGITDRMTFQSRLVLSIIRWNLPAADGAKLLYPTQLEEIDTSPPKRLVCFHNLVPLAACKDGSSHANNEPPFLLMLGHPWFLKGADTLIRAFHRIKDEFPDLTLKIVGYCEEPKPYEELRAEDERILLVPSGVPHGEALRLMSQCHVYVLASRTEGMGRVLLEAMAASRPIVAAAVDGVPTIVRDDDNGLLFEPGSVDQLADRLRKLLRDSQLRLRLSRRGYERARTEFSEDAYARKYYDFLKDVCGPKGVKV